MKNTKKALLLSVMSLVLCVSMLVGTTFAWFTDSVSTAKNTIASGNLDVVLSYKLDKNDAWAEVNENTELFDDAALWEPGYTQVVYLKVANVGSLALKYQLGLNILSELSGTNVDEETFKLSDYIEFGVIETKTENFFADRDEARKAVTSSKKISAGYSKASELYATNNVPTDGLTEEYVALVVYMPETVGNEANHLTGTAAPSITLGLNLFATQFTKEMDSYDEYYDLEAAVFTVEDANKMLAQNKNVSLINCTEPNGIVYVPANYTGTLVLQDVSIASVQESAAISTIDANGNTTAAAEEIDIVILGNVNVKAIADGMSAITASKLNIRGSGLLTAIAQGNAAFGIGGMDTESVKVSDITIASVKGGQAGKIGSDTKYYKDAPEGGAAIGSGRNGAVISLNNVKINEAIGGSKAAGIGARYHVGVTVNITNSVIDYVEGGATAAAIGGSRVSGDATENGTTINIANSTITAKGGVYGAGIGSGYDVHCASLQPLCTINITDSTINATGGQYAAGVGTGYHNAALAGEIKGSTVNAVSGEKVYKSSYTAAMDVGFGVVDPSREGQQTTSSLTYNGTTITMGDAAKIYAYDNAVMGGLYELLPTLKSGDVLILPEGTYETSGTFTVAAGVTIMGEAGKEVIIRQTSAAQDDIFNCAGDVTIENITFESNRKGYAVADNTKNHDTDGNITIRNCKFKGIAVEKNYGVYKNLNGNLVIENCTFDNYNNAICGVNNGNGSTTTITGCTFTNINGEAIGYVSSTLPADFEANAIANNTGLTADNVIGY